MFDRYQNFPREHVTITPHNTNPLPRPMIIVAGSAGNIVVKDKFGVQITYPMLAGGVLPMMPEIVMATNTTVNPVIGVY